MSSGKGWVGVDLDGTLAEYDGFKGPTIIGKPIAAMVERIHGWLRAGIEVRIFTARVFPITDLITEDFKPELTGGDAEYQRRHADAIAAAAAIRVWCREHIGVSLPITCVKDYSMFQLWDDRAVQVIPNMGVALEHEIDELGSASAVLMQEILEGNFSHVSKRYVGNNKALQAIGGVLSAMSDRRGETKHREH